MKIVIDIDCEKETCGKCGQRVKNIPVLGGVPIIPFCFIFHNLVRDVKVGGCWKSPRLPVCIAATIKTNEEVKQ